MSVSTWILQFSNLLNHQQHGLFQTIYWPLTSSSTDFQRKTYDFTKWCSITEQLKTCEILGSHYRQLWHLVNIFWYVTPCSFVKMIQQFRLTCYLILQHNSRKKWKLQVRLKFYKLPICTVSHPRRHKQPSEHLFTSQLTILQTYFSDIYILMQQCFLLSPIIRC